MDPMDPMDQGPLALYLHWPFCKGICPYCDFNRELAVAVDQGAWAGAYEREIAHQGARTSGRTLESIFFGGGTPSLMDPDVMARIITAARATWDFAPDIEITMEANPTSAEANRFEAYAKAGVNRLSLGVQALNDTDLAALGRKHSASEAREAITLARTVFSRWSFDLIYARPGQTFSAWQAELEEALALDPSHLSLYQLTIEEGTPFHLSWARGDLVLPEEGLADELYHSTLDRLAQAGLAAYEVSNHARAGEEARHNLIYWHSGDYLGIGPGAHGRLSEMGVRIATRQHRAAALWLAEVERTGSAPQSEERLGHEQLRDEIFLMGLRTYKGVMTGTSQRLLGKSPVECLNPKALALYQAHGWVAWDEEGVRVTPQGMSRLNGLLVGLLDHPLGGV